MVIKNESSGFLMFECSHDPAEMVGETPAANFSIDTGFTGYSAGILHEGGDTDNNWCSLNYAHQRSAWITVADVSLAFILNFVKKKAKTYILDSYMAPQNL